MMRDTLTDLVCTEDDNNYYISGKVDSSKLAQTDAFSSMGMGSVDMNVVFTIDKATLYLTNVKMSVENVNQTTVVINKCEIVIDNITYEDGEIEIPSDIKENAVDYYEAMFGDTFDVTDNTEETSDGTELEEGEGEEWEEIPYDFIEEQAEENEGYSEDKSVG
jgi:hypothetical protein